MRIEPRQTQLRWAQSTYQRNLLLMHLRCQTTNGTQTIASRPAQFQCKRSCQYPIPSGNIRKKSKEPVGEAFFHFITRGGKHVLRHEFAEQPISCLRPCSTWGGPHPQPSVGHNYKDYYHYTIWHENYVWIGIEPRERASAGMSRNCQAKGSTWESPTTYLPRHSLNPLATDNSSVTLRENG